MAAKDLDSDVIKRQELNDMTTCCICIEVFKDPKALPCIHTFCMKCLQETGLKNNKAAGEEMPCPICRRMFKIPPEGFHGLPKNFFIQNLIQVTNVSERSGSSRAALCDACLDENNEDSGKEIPAADTFCVDCNQKFCEECCRLHKKLKVTKNHKLIQIDGDQNMMTDLVPSVCEQHEHSVLNVYCADCKTVVCAICFIDDHNNHKGSHVKKFVDDFRKQIEDNTKAIHEYISKTEAIKAKILNVKEDIQKRAEDLECDVEKRKDELRQFTDRQAASLLQNLCSIRQSRMKEIQLDTDDIDTYLSSLVTYNSYCQTMLAKGSASDICRAFADLSLRALELKEQCQPMIEREMQSFNLCFRKSELEQFLEESCDNLIGEIEEEGNPKPRKRSKESQLEEQSNKIDLLNKEIKMEKTDNENLTLSIGQLKINIDTEIQVNKALRDELDNEKAKYDSCTEKLKKEVDENSSLIANNDKLKKDLDARNMAINSLQDNIDQLRQELDKEKINKTSLQTDKDKIKQDLDKEKSTTNSLNVSKNKLVEEGKKLEEELKTMNTNKLRYNEGQVLVKRIRPEAAEEGDKSNGDLTFTILDEELFIASGMTSEVEVYDTTKLSFSRRWNLKELIDSKDIVSCNGNKCLYIMDYKGEGQSKEILRVDRNGNLIKNWSTGDVYGWGLSVTNELNVILAVYDQNKLIEYSSDGKLIRQINLSSDARIRKPWHAIKLSNGDFVVSHGYDVDELHRVCVVDADGQLKKSFGGKCGTGTGEMIEPSYLAVDRDGFVMVADRSNRRVLLLDSDLKFKGVILSREKHALPDPTKILLDESNGRLFVGVRCGMLSWRKLLFRHQGEEHCEILIFDF